MRQKGFAPILVILFILGGLAAGVYILGKGQFQHVRTLENEKLNTTPSAAVSSDRPELGLDEINKQVVVNDADGEKEYKLVNRDNPNDFKPYTNKQAGISIEFPYNSNWGTDKFKTRAYEESYSYEGKLQIKFGPVSLWCEGSCGWHYPYYLQLETKGDKQTFIKDLYDQGKVAPDTNFEQLTINGLTVLKWPELGMCSGMNYTIIGRKYNYTIIEVCGDDSEKEQAFIRQTIEHIKLID